MSATHIDVVTISGDGSSNNDDPMGQAEAEAAASEVRQAAVAGRVAAAEPLGPQGPQGVAIPQGATEPFSRAAPQGGAASLGPQGQQGVAAPQVAVIEPLELRDRVVSSDTWTRDELRFRDLSHPTVYVPQMDDRIRTQAEALANLELDAVSYGWNTATGRAIQQGIMEAEAT